MSTPSNLREIRLQQCEVLRGRMREYLEQTGWSQSDKDAWLREAGKAQVTIESQAPRGWRVTVRSGDEVMGLSFNSRSFGSAIREAERLYEVTQESEKERMEEERLREREMREHYGLSESDREERF